MTTKKKTTVKRGRPPLKKKTTTKKTSKTSSKSFSKTSIPKPLKVLKDDQDLLNDELDDIFDNDIEGEEDYEEQDEIDEEENMEEEVIYKPFKKTTFTESNEVKHTIKETKGTSGDPIDVEFESEIVDNIVKFFGHNYFIISEQTFKSNKKSIKSFLIEKNGMKYAIFFDITKLKLFNF